MTREEAIKAFQKRADCIKELLEEWRGNPKNFEETLEIYSMAIETLKQPEIIKCKDCIHSSGVKMVDGWTYCAEGRLLVKYENGYCSDARRREE